MLLLRCLLLRLPVCVASWLFLAPSILYLIHAFVVYLFGLSVFVPFPIHVPYLLFCYPVINFTSISLYHAIYYFVQLLFLYTCSHQFMQLYNHQSIC